MNIKRFIIGCVIVSIYVFAYEWVFHGIVLEELYAQNPPLWRTPGNMGGPVPWLVLGQLIFAVLFSFIFTLGLRQLIDDRLDDVRSKLSAGAVVPAQTPPSKWGSGAVAKETFEAGVVAGTNA